MNKAMLIGCLALALSSGPANAAPGGSLRTLPLGHYICELPGDALGPAARRQPDEEFTVTFGSSYQTSAGKGTYLLTGDRALFTAGPLKDIAYRRVGTNVLRRILADNSEGPLRCVRQGS